MRIFSGMTWIQGLKIQWVCMTMWLSALSSPRLLVSCIANFNDLLSDFLGVFPGALDAFIKQCVSYPHLLNRKLYYERKLFNAQFKQYHWDGGGVMV